MVAEVIQLVDIHLAGLVADTMLVVGAAEDALVVVEVFLVETIIIIVVDMTILVDHFQEVFIMIIILIHREEVQLLLIAEEVD